MTMESIESQSSDLRTKIEQSAINRAAYTRSYLASAGMDPLDFANKLKVAPFEITVDANDDKSLALAVFDLQKKLGFPESDSAKGCDGKFGPYTKRAFESASDDLSAPLITEEAPRQGNELSENVSLNNTAFVGDSLTVGMSRFIPGAVKLYRGGMQTTWMKNQLVKLIADHKKGKYPRLKRVVIMGGINDLTNGAKGSKHVIENLRQMYIAAKDAGLSVVACTIPDWEHERLHRKWTNRWEKKGGSYPYTASELHQQTLEINKWIFSQKGGLVDTVVDTYAGNFQKSRDGLHRTTAGSRQMARAIMSQGEISG